MQKDDLRLLATTVGTSFLAYHAYIQLRKLLKTRETPDFVPVGVVKSLYIYPAKSCKGKQVFSFFCGAKGPEIGDIRDRHFQLIDGKTGVFWTARQKPQMVLIDVDVRDGEIHVTLPDGRSVAKSLAEIKQRNDVRQTTLHAKLRTDGYDCGDELSILLSPFLEEDDVRMVMFSGELFTERICRTQPQWWNNPVPKREDHVAYSDLAPYMIQTEASLNYLNSRLEEEVTQLNFRPVIVVDKCAAWDEDKWLDVRIGDDVELQCFKPCTRCVLTTVNPSTGKKHPGMQPLKMLREFRLAPEGPMRADFKDSPIFGVNAGVVKQGYIHEGQVVYARYKPSAF